MSTLDASLAAPPVRDRKIAARIWARAYATVDFRIGMGVFLALALAAIFYPMFSGIDPTKMAIKLGTKSHKDGSGTVIVEGRSLPAVDAKSGRSIVCVGPN